MLKFIQRIVTDTYKIEFYRTLIVLVRFFVLFKILKKGRKFKNTEENLNDHITIKRDNKKLGVDDHNLHYSENLLNFKKTYGQFNGQKTKIITSPLVSIDYLDFNNAKVLSVGPRNEGELYYLRSLGFKWSNIHSIDLLSYSSKIELGDIHKSNYEDSSFDVIICGWVLSYSNNFKKILEEMYRISRNKAIISIGYTFTPEQLDKVRIFKSRENVLDTNKQIIDFYGNKIKTIYFNYDAYTDNKNIERKSILIFRLKK